ASAACTETYTVVSGDDCTLIPQKASISTYQLTFLNSGLNCNALSVGQSLCVRDSTYDCQPVYQVQSGDGCWDIANSHGITSDQLLANNPNIGSDCNIQPGEMLCVAAPTATTTTSRCPSIGLQRFNRHQYPATSCTATYSVQSGDNCDLIASKNSISNYQLTTLNPSMDCSLLQIGQSLCIKSPLYDCQPVYVVSSGDGCSAIADSHGISLDQLYTDNPNLQNACNIYVGQTLCVAGSGTPTTTTTTAAPTRTIAFHSFVTPTSTECTLKTTVMDGENCDTICERAGVSRYWLGQLNPSINSQCTNIVSGQALCIDSAINTCGSVYSIKGTEGSCTGIATSLGMEVSDLMALNPNIDSGCTNIYVGEVICTAKKATGTPSSECTRHYTLSSGDTCTVTAAKNSLTNTQLLQLNPGLSCSSMIPDTVLCTFTPATSICPNLVQTNLNDDCFSLAQNVSMSLEEWQSINQGLDCDPLQLNYIVCSAHGNATLPEEPSGENPTSNPLCGAYDKSQYCCTQYSVSADLFSSDLCLRANGCQENCRGDSGVTVPTGSATPTFTLTPTAYPTPTAMPSECDNCTDSQCCTAFGTCYTGLSSWYCQAENGCTKNCDKGLPSGWVDLPVVPVVNYTFPDGDYSAYGGNPCQVCNATTALLESASGDYCCTQNLQCLPTVYDDCRVSRGCLYNCFIEFPDDEDECSRTGVCTYTTTIVEQPWESGSPFDSVLEPDDEEPVAELVRRRRPKSF
ncbi:hypothetical protein BDZ89DRAFT_947610, partial [Hymenopellis radicata]